MPIRGKKDRKQQAIRAPQTSGRTTRGALAGVVRPTPELAHIVGSKPLSRGDAMRNCGITFASTTCRIIEREER